MPQRGRIPPKRMQAQPQASGLPWNMQLVQAERQTTIESLKKRRTSAQVIELVDKGRAVAAETVTRLMAHYPDVPPLACRAGCAWCCYKSVAVSAAEVIRIATHLRATLSPDDLAGLQARIAALDDRIRTMSSLQRAKAHLPCALLVDQHCSIHAVRPLTCAGWNSLDVRECIAEWQDPESSPVTSNILQIEAFQAICLGMDLGLTELGLESEPLELTTALRIALEIPDVAERWLAGEPIFAPARWADRQQSHDDDAREVGRSGVGCVCDEQRD